MNGPYIAASQMCHLYYAAEMARLAGADAFPPELAATIETEADELYGGLMAIVGAIEDAGRRADAVADLEQLQANARQRARGYLAGTAFMNVPRDTAVGARSHEAYTESAAERRADADRHLERLRSLIGAVSEAGAPRP